MINESVGISYDSDIKKAKNIKILEQKALLLQTIFIMVLQKTLKALQALQRY